MLSSSNQVGSSVDIPMTMLDLVGRIAGAIHGSTPTLEIWIGFVLCSIAKLIYIN